MCNVENSTLFKIHFFHLLYQQSIKCEKTRPCIWMSRHLKYQNDTPPPTHAQEKALPKLQLLPFTNDIKSRAFLYNRAFAANWFLPQELRQESWSEV